MGCATIKEAAKGIAGNSTKALEENRKSALVKTFDYDYFSCYTKTVDILKKRSGAYIYVQDIKRHMIALYVSEADTTAVGIFFKEIDNNKTQVEVSSASTYAKELIAGKVFDLLNPKQKEGQADAKQEMGNK
jgi:hypothetical protein